MTFLCKPLCNENRPQKNNEKKKNTGFIRFNSQRLNRAGFPVGSMTDEVDSLGKKQHVAEMAEMLQKGNNIIEPNSIEPMGEISR